ncbi:MAG: DUF4040 domain-containing protein [Cyanobacteria bacterium P01_C01_bin.120]
MSENLYIVAIAALLPLTAGMLVTQANPYHALVIRGILGAVAALVYALFGAADVALTEALVGTMLSITLYAIAVRSSMSLRLGVLATSLAETHSSPSQQLFPALRTVLKPHQLRLEVVSFDNPQALQRALEGQEIHAVYLPTSLIIDEPVVATNQAAHTLNIRLPQLYDLVAAALPPELADVNFSRALRLEPATPSPDKVDLRNALEGQS